MQDIIKIIGRMLEKEIILIDLGKSEFSFLGFDLDLHILFGLKFK